MNLNRRTFLTRIASAAAAIALAQRLLGAKWEQPGCEDECEHLVGMDLACGPSKSALAVWVKEESGMRLYYWFGEDGYTSTPIFLSDTPFIIVP